MQRRLDVQLARSVFFFRGKFAEAIDLGEKEKLEIPGPLEWKFQGVGWV